MQSKSIEKKVIGWKAVSVNAIYESSYGNNKRVYLEQTIKEQLSRIESFKYSEHAPKSTQVIRTKRRVMFKDIPASWKKQDVINILQDYPEAKILKVLSNSMIITGRDKKIIESKEFTKRQEYLERKRRNQLIPRSKNGKVFYTGPDMYLRYILSLKGGEDIDLRDQPTRLKFSDLVKAPDQINVFKEVELENNVKYE